MMSFSTSAHMSASFYLTSILLISLSCLKKKTNKQNCETHKTDVTSVFKCWQDVQGENEITCSSVRLSKSPLIMVIFLSATSTVPEGQSSAFSAASMSSLELIEAVTDISLGDTRPDVKSLLTEPDDGLNRLLSSQVDPVKVQDVHSVLRVLVLKPWL